MRKNILRAAGDPYYGVKVWEWHKGVDSIGLWLARSGFARTSSSTTAYPTNHLRLNGSNSLAGRLSRAITLTAGKTYRMIGTIPDSISADGQAYEGTELRVCSGNANDGSPTWLDNVYTDDYPGSDFDVEWTNTHGSVGAYIRLEFQHLGLGGDTSIGLYDIDIYQID